jgi:hypothetical protein
MTTAEQIIEQYDHEARHILRTTHIDLDAFLALSVEQRAARWRQLDGGAKFQLVALAIVRQTGRDWEVEEVERCVAHWDGKYGAVPLPTEAAVAGALERLADAHQRSALTALTAEERTYFRRWAGAFRKALLYWQQGIRPEQTPGGAWLLTSATRAGQVHRVTRDGQCTCEAQNRGCWHAALVTGIETGYEDLDSLNSYVEPEDQAVVAAAARDLGRRLAAARAACYQVAA